jgi:hypothetical protein
VDGNARAALARAKARLDRLDFYPAPVRLEHVHLFIAPLLFRLPGFRRYHGYALWRTIILKRPLGRGSEDLITHELCHVWQVQHRPLACLRAWVFTRYEENPFELEARRAVEQTRERAA